MEAKRIKVAVLDYRIASDISQEYSKLMADWTILGLVSSGYFDVAERDQIEKILLEKSLQQAGIIDNSLVTEIGKLVRVDFVAVGTLCRIESENRYEGIAKIIAVESGKIVLTHAISVSDIADLKNAVIHEIRDNYPTHGFVISVDGNFVTTDINTYNRLAPGTLLLGYKEGDDLIHPATGEVIEKKRIDICELRITEVGEKISKAVFIKKFSRDIHLEPGDKVLTTFLRSPDLTFIQQMKVESESDDSRASKKHKKREIKNYIKKESTSDTEDTEKSGDTSGGSSELSDNSALSGQYAGKSEGDNIFKRYIDPDNSLKNFYFQKMHRLNAFRTVGIVFLIIGS
ncbi:MAG: hypothetical protein KAS39_02655, partial [Actinomycetia bacterium]|nr:hypothetical protein [Actinomycetes bacterium]